MTEEINNRKLAGKREEKCELGIGNEE